MFAYYTHLGQQTLANLIFNISQNKESRVGDLDPWSLTWRILDTHWEEREKCITGHLITIDEFKIGNQSSG